MHQNSRTISLPRWLVNPPMRMTMRMVDFIPEPLLLPLMYINRYIIMNVARDMHYIRTGRFYPQRVRENEDSEGRLIEGNREENK